MDIYPEYRPGLMPERQRKHNPAERCATCWALITDRQHMRRGRCNACAKYLAVNGQERPYELYARFKGTCHPTQRGQQTDPE